MPGVRNVEVNFEGKEAYLTYDPDKGDVAAMIKALDKAGYQGAFRADGRPAR